MNSSGHSAETASMRDPDPILMPFSTQLAKTILQLNCKTPVVISCWYSPHEFFVQLKDKIESYEKMMRRLQTVYKNGVPIDSQPTASNYVIAKHRKDNMYYRARIIEYNPQLRKYKTEFVDVGSRPIVFADEVYPVAKEFCQLPMMAIKVSLESIVSCCDWTDLTNNLDRYINPQNSVICEFLQAENDRYYATVKIENSDLKTSLIIDNFVMDLSESK